MGYDPFFNNGLLQNIVYTPGVDQPLLPTPDAATAATNAAANIAIQASNDFIDAKNLAYSALQQSVVSVNWASSALSNLAPFAPDWLGATYGVVASSIPDPSQQVTDFSNDVQNAFEFALAEFPHTIQPIIANFLTTFFPNINPTVATTSDAWLANTINTGIAVPIPIENALWNRARDREVNDAARATTNAYESFASRGFSMPPGALGAMQVAIQQDLAKKNASINRDIAGKDFDVLIDTTKFAVSESVKLRSEFVKAMGDFIRVMATHVNYAVEYARTVLTAKTNVFEAAMKLYMGRVDNQKMLIAAQIGQADADIRYKDFVFKAKVEGYTSNFNIVKLQADTAVAASKIMFDVASSAFSTRNTMVSLATSA